MQDAQQSTERKFRHGLSVILFAWFMILSLGPITVIGFNEYREGKQTIVQTRYEQLSTVNQLLSQQINDYFDSVVTNLFIKAGVAREFLLHLIKGHKDLRKSTETFINSDSYNQILTQYSSEFVDFLRYYDYSDLILGDTEGNILFTVNAYDDLGQNIFNGTLANTSFAKAARESLEDLVPKYADVTAYPPIGDQKVSFFILPLVDEGEKAIGFLAVQILAHNVQNIFESENQFSDALKSYLIGEDGYIRYGTDLDSSQSMILKADNILTQDWVAHIDAEGVFHEIHDHDMDDESHGIDSGAELNELFGGELDLHSEASDSHKVDQNFHIKSYTNVYGERVLGTFYAIEVAGTPMALISEVSQEDAFASVVQFRNRLIYITAITALVVILIALVITRRLVRPIRSITAWVNRVASGDYAQGAVLSGHNEISDLSRSFSEMTEKLRNVISDNDRKSWQQEGQAGLNNCMRGEQELSEVCKNIVSYLARYLDMQTGAMYVMNDEKRLQLMASYAWKKRQQSKNSFEIGEGLVGQAAMEKQAIELTSIPEDYIKIESGLGSTSPKVIITVPLVYEGEVKGVLEFALIRELTGEQRGFLEDALESVAIGINSAQYRTRVNQLLEKTTRQSEAMKEQQEELRSVNDELESRARVLEESQEELKAQSEEMQKSNAELEEKTELLQQQKAEIERKNLDIELSRKTLEDKAKELEQASKYKSEFLANMSHELRTPLNSLLLLAQMLADNDEGNLNEDQIESAQVIYSGGKELLDLINDILDLSKVEAGKMSINLEDMDIEELCSSMRTLFKPLADNKGLDFAVDIDPGTTRVILSDSQRVMQVLKNFLSNAFKFTEKGGVYIRVFNSIRKTDHGNETYVGFAVRDTGIGIPKEKQDAVFEAFQQADGSTSRKYGGTGLGLAISRELSSMLGGYIGIESVEGEGTTFTVYLPDNAVCSLDGGEVMADSHSSTTSDGYQKIASATAEKKAKAEPAPVAEKMPTKKKTSEAGKNILIIEDDEHFSDIVKQLSGSHGYQCLVEASGKEGIQTAIKEQPIAIILDLGLPDMDGEEVLRQLQKDDVTKDIPVHIVSGRDPDESDRQGAVGYLVKPVSIDDLETVFSTLETALSEDIQHALLLDSDAESRSHLAKMLTEKGMNIAVASSAEEAEKSMSENQWQCLVMDVDLPDSSGLAFLQKLQEKMGDNMPSIVIHTDKELTTEDQKELQKYTRALVMKGDYASERVMDEVSLFIHSVEKSAPAELKSAAGTLNNKSLKGHKILLVDDDLRNTFALSKGLQGLGLEVVIADNGQNALDKLDEEDGIELVLMDIMMPVMDGYEAMTRMREIDRLKNMPVIALTAKAMSDDKAKCIEAGANDYMTKPVNIDKLTEMMKVWLFK
ncbi:response regulator [Endozoicomonas sp. 8E]|uniref:response regulator n=1 Tax=Endozoicomonas sp. 8E TaxID=3035692 RepID=UPI002938E845|nr:response regulator [Endozoicomonas sp. 8E]WOG27138.1 response regulator [Endozoicomonas sp. 8E]